MKFFTLSELTASATAKAKGIDNTPTIKHKANLEALVARILDPLREAYGKPIRVTSGYRSYDLNKAVGGSKTSQHAEGRAADITGGSVFENIKIFQLAIDLGLPYDQLIYEKGNNIGPQWVHVSYDPTRNRKQILRTTNGRTYFNCDRNGKAI